jgi:hypothetical protein
MPRTAYRHRLRKTYFSLYRSENCAGRLGDPIAHAFPENIYSLTLSSYRSTTFPQH